VSLGIFDARKLKEAIAMRQRTIWSSVVLGAGAMACAGKSFVRADPPITAQQVSIGLVDETCALDTDPDQGGSLLLDLGITLRVTNGAAGPVAFHADRSRVLFAGREAVSDDRPETIGVGAGSKKEVRVHFVLKGRDVGCNTLMSLALDKAVELDGKPLPVAPLAFQPSNSPDS
jgi:hypothetical protein